MPMPTAEQAFKDAFKVPRDPRSDEYKAGVVAVLRYRLDAQPMTRCPHPLGTAAADAWFSGVDEGHSIFRRHQERVHGTLGR